jgi:hypothetical protein
MSVQRGDAAVRSRPPGTAARRAASPRIPAGEAPLGVGRWKVTAVTAAIGGSIGPAEALQLRRLRWNMNDTSASTMPITARILAM